MTPRRPPSPPWPPLGPPRTRRYSTTERAEAARPRPHRFRRFSPLLPPPLLEDSLLFLRSPVVSASPPLQTRPNPPSASSTPSRACSPLAARLKTPARAAADRRRRRGPGRRCCCTPSLLLLLLLLLLLWPPSRSTPRTSRALLLISRLGGLPRGALQQRQPRQQQEARQLPLLRPAAPERGPSRRRRPSLPLQAPRGASSACWSRAGSGGSAAAAAEEEEEEEQRRTRWSGREALTCLGISLSLSLPFSFFSLTLPLHL